jgi:hypothetical protein
MKQTFKNIKKPLDFSKAVRKKADIMTSAEYKVMKGKSPIKRKSPESDMQQCCMRYFNSKYPEFKPYFIAIPNAQKREIKTDKKGRKYVPSANKQIAEGMKAGVWDIFIAIPKGKNHGLWLEMKIKPNKLSPLQQQFYTDIRKMDYACEVIFSFEQFKTCIDWYMNLK